MSDTLKPTVSSLQLRDELETMVLKELLGPGSAEEELIQSPGKRYFVGVMAPRQRARTGAVPARAAVAPPAEDKEAETDGEIFDGDVASGCTDLNLCHDFHEKKQDVRYTISEAARREVLARLLKLNHERYAKEVKQGLHEKKKPKAPKGKKGAKVNTQEEPSLFQGEEDA